VKVACTKTETNECVTVVTFQSSCDLQYDLP